MDKTKILFVCLGNICRSPSAEAVMKAMVEKKGLTQRFEIDSAGTAAYHSGEPADQRMQRHAINRNYRLTSISRKVNAKVDFDYFDYIIAMDDQNVEDLEFMAHNDAQRAKISKMTDYCTSFEYTTVPDPYYGGAAGFELVLDLLEDACMGLINHIENA
nr:low molecular weight protein-tyrosine-phosphatase [uncultured Carboxylicivirga sp.]